MLFAGLTKLCVNLNIEYTVYRNQHILGKDAALAGTQKGIGMQTPLSAGIM
jgi:hypothetical protein